MSTPTPPCHDFDLLAPACVEWKSNNATQSLIDPDPPRDSLMLQSRFVSETSSASFQLHCPIRVKGIESQSYILGLIHPRSIISFDFNAYPELPDIVRKKLNCEAIRLRFELNRPLDLVAAATATEPVQPRKRLSGQAFDALRSLATATAFDIYVSARELPQIKLAAVRETVSQALLKPLSPDLPNTLASLYGGSGGKLIEFSPRSDASTSQSDEPPSYDELEPPPPPDIESTSLHKPEPLLPAAPLTRHNDKKRRRLDDSSSPLEIDVWAMVAEMREEMHKLVKRVEQLEKENKELNRELEGLRSSCENVTDVVDADGTALLEVHEELNDLKERVDFLTQDGLDSDAEESIVETVTNRVLSHMLEKNYNAKLSIEKS